MRSPAVGDCVAATVDDVVEPEPCAAKLADAREDAEPIGEARRLPVSDVRLEHERLDALIAKRLIPARVALEIRNARDLEPHEVDRVVRDALRVGLGKTNHDVGVEAEPVHDRTLRGCISPSAQRGVVSIRARAAPAPARQLRRFGQ